MVTIYTTLNPTKAQIRLLTLSHSADADSEIHCQLQVVDLLSSDKICYETLSYTWGDTSKRRVIFISGSPILVTENLYTALRVLRGTSKPRELWVDAICIDQCNTTERNRQVQLMSSIYSNATQVIVWFGEPDSDTTTAMEYLLQQSAKNSVQELVTKLDTNLPTSVISGIKKLQHNPWWSRVWVLQEVALARTCPTVLCGPYPISFEVLHRLRIGTGPEVLDTPGKLGSTLALKVASRLESLMLTYSWQDQNLPKPTMAKLLSNSRHRQASDPRDKIFALIGLDHAESEEDLTPNYFLSMSEVFQRASLTLYNSDDTSTYTFNPVAGNDSSVSLTRYVSGDSSNTILYAAAGSNKSLPTWCIDFSKNGWCEEDYYYYSGYLSQRARCNENIPQCKVRRLAGSGIAIFDIFEIGSVEQVFDCHRSRNKPNLDSLTDDLSETQKRFIEVLRIARLCEDLSSFISAAFKALTVRLGVKRARRLLGSGEIWSCLLNRPKEFNDAFHRFEYLTQQTFINYSRISAEWATNCSRVTWADCLGLCDMIRINRLARLQTFFVTSNGYIGKSLGTLRRGDLLCISSNSSLPMVLRTSGEFYELVSFAWVQGVMYGELRESNTEVQRKSVYVI